MAKGVIICDTDAMLDYWKTAITRHNATKDILENEIGLSYVAISAVTKIETLYGAVNKLDQTKLIKNMEPYLTLLINNDISLKAIMLIEKYALSHKLSMPDSLIAASAIATGLPLFTYNIKDYKFIEGLQLYVPKKT